MISPDLIMPVYEAAIYGFCFGIFTFALALLAVEFGPLRRRSKSSNPLVVNTL
jgi:hypothetical protein